MPQDPSWVSSHNSPWRDITGHDRSGPHNGPCTDGDTGTNKGLCRNPGIGLNGHGRFAQWTVGPVNVMAARAQMGPL